VKIPFFISFSRPQYISRQGGVFPVFLGLFSFSGDEQRSAAKNVLFFHQPMKNSVNTKRKSEMEEIFSFHSFYFPYFPLSM
jgi:hypothetical protein